MPPRGGVSLKITPMAGKKGEPQGSQFTVLGSLTQAAFTWALAVQPTPSIAALPTSLVSVSMFLASKLPACGLNVLPILAFVLNPHLPTRPAGKLFAWNLVKSEQARRKCCFAPIVLAWLLLFLGVYLLAVLCYS